MFNLMHTQRGKFDICCNIIVYTSSVIAIEEDPLIRLYDRCAQTPHVGAIYGHEEESRFRGFTDHSRC